MEDCDFIDREFKIAVIKNLKEIQENSEGKFNELWNKINEQMSTVPNRLKYNK